jgi:hypothetical protein
MLACTPLQKKDPKKERKKEKEKEDKPEIEPTQWLGRTTTGKPLAWDYDNSYPIR